MLRDRCFPSPATVRCGLIALVALATCLLSSTQASAQTYTWEKIDPAFQQQTTKSAKMGLKTQVIMGNAGLASNRDSFDDWYRKYLFPAMSSLEYLGDLRSNRDSLMKDLERASDSTTHQVLLDLAYEEAVKRATGDYHPAVKFNALLILGQLNQVELRRAERLPPVRLPKAFDFLLAELKKPDQHEAVRLGAMFGIRRHVFMVSQRPQDQPIPDAQKAEVATLMTSLMAEKTTPENRDERLHIWMRRGAVDTLAALGQVGDGQSIFRALVAVMGDSDEPLSLRLYAARAIGSLDYTNVTGIDAVGTAQKIAAVVAYACRQEDDRIKEMQDEMDAKDAAGSGGTYAGGYPGMSGGYDGGYEGDDEYGGGDYEGEGEDTGYGGDYGSPYGMPLAGEESEDVVKLRNDARRLLKFPILCGQLGIRGELKSSFGAGSDTLGSIAQLATDDAQKAEITKILDAMDALLEATDLVEEEVEEMMTQVRTKTRDLTAILPASAIEEEDEAGDEADLPGGDLPGAAAAATN